MDDPLGSGEKLYIRHIGIFDNVETDLIYETCLSRAKEKKLPTEEQQAEYLKKEDIWTTFYEL